MFFIKDWFDDKNVLPIIPSAKLLPPEDLGGGVGQPGGNTVNLRNNASKKKGKCCSGSADPEPVTNRRSAAAAHGSNYSSFQSWYQHQIKSCVLAFIQVCIISEYVAFSLDKSSYL